MTGRLPSVPPQGGDRIPTAALVVIGNEILSGKVVDTNSPFLARRLYELGVELRRIETVPDEMDEIVRSVRSASAGFDYVLTSGGIGPTHDDMTIAAVAQALERKVVYSPAMEHLLKLYYGVDELTVAQGRLAQVPEGSELIYPQDSPYPQLVVGNVYIFPGVPEHLRIKFEHIADLFKGMPMQARTLELECLETDIAERVREAADRYPQVRIGSYPKQHEGGWKVELVLESRSGADLEAAVTFLGRELGL